MSDFRKARTRVALTTGESVRIVRELQELSQGQLEDLSGVQSSMIAAIEENRVNLDVEHAKTLARALKCHPSVLAFPGWDVEAESVA